MPGIQPRTLSVSLRELLINNSDLLSVCGSGVAVVVAFSKQLLFFTVRLSMVFLSLFSSRITARNHEYNMPELFYQVCCQDDWERVHVPGQAVHRGF